MAQYGVGRGLDGDYPADYDDDRRLHAGLAGEVHRHRPRHVIRFAREWARTAEQTEGKCIDHHRRRHQPLVSRQPDVPRRHRRPDVLRLRRRERRRAHSLRRPGETGAGRRPGRRSPWAADWAKPPRLQNAPSFHYVHSDQWRYESDFTDYDPDATRWPRAIRSPRGTPWTSRSVPCATAGCRSTRSSTAARSRSVKQAEAAGGRQRPGDRRLDGGAAGREEAEVRGRDPDAPENWPRVWFIWRGNALMASAKGHEYFLKHYLGTHTNAIAPETGRGHSSRTWSGARRRRQGKMDLVVDLNFRMDTSALYSDIVLPAATWYEKDDLNSHRHAQLHPSAAGRGAALLGVEERLGDLQGAGQEGQRTGGDPSARAGARHRRRRRCRTIPRPRSPSPR